MIPVCLIQNADDHFIKGLQTASQCHAQDGRINGCLLYDARDLELWLKFIVPPILFDGSNLGLFSSLLSRVGGAGSCDQDRHSRDDK